MKCYGYSKCSTCRKAQAWLREQGQPDELVPIRETPPSTAELRAMLGYLQGNRKRLINTSSKDYRESGLKDRLADLSDEQLFAELRSNGNLIKRPFLLTQQGGTTGFQPAEWQALLAGI